MIRVSSPFTNNSVATRIPDFADTARMVMSIMRSMLEVGVRKQCFGDRVHEEQQYDHEMAADMSTNIAHAKNTADAPHASSSLVYVIVEMVRDILALSSRCTEMVAVVDSWKPYSTTIWNTRQNDVANRSRRTSPR